MNFLNLRSSDWLKGGGGGGENPLCHPAQSIAFLIVSSLFKRVWNAIERTVEEVNWWRICQTCGSCQILSGIRSSSSSTSWVAILHPITTLHVQCVREQNTPFPGSVALSPTDKQLKYSESTISKVCSDAFVSEFIETGDFQAVTVAGKVVEAKNNVQFKSFSAMMQIAESQIYLRKKDPVWFGPLRTRILRQRGEQRSWKNSNKGREDWSRSSWTFLCYPSS